MNNVATQQTVRFIEPPNSLGNQMSDWTMFYSQPDILPLWESRTRDSVLRQYRYAAHNTLPVGASSQMISRVRQTPWELVGGGKILTRKYQELLQNAEFGKGWGLFLSKVLEDYLWQDNGAFIEVVGPGDPNTELKSMPTGLAHLDSARVYATGNPEFPFLYLDRQGKLHRMHISRILRLVDSPTPVEERFELGYCYGSRIIAVAKVQILMSQYTTERLSDLPPSGIVTVSGMTDIQFMQAMERYTDERHADGNSVWSNLMRLVSINPNAPVKVEITPFSNLPEHFDYGSTMEAHVNLTALALGDDPQNIWPLTGQPLGTGTQSKILHAKGQAKTFGLLLQELERAINIWVLPAEMEFKFKFQDIESDKERAETAQLWVEMTQQASFLSETEKRQLVANNVESFKDVLIDEAGNLRLPDDDKKPERSADDATTVTPQTEQVPPVAESSNPIPPQFQQKDYGTTEKEFITNVSDLITAVNEQSINRARFGLVMRAQLRRLGDRAFRDGLEAGGVQEDMSEDDRKQYDQLLAEASGYVTDFANQLYSDKITISDTDARAKMWANGSLVNFFQAGLLSADRNGLYEWKLGSTQEHCRDCLRLNGQKHRLKDWHAKGWLPQSHSLACTGLHCGCRLERTTGRASGRF